MLVANTGKADHSKSIPDIIKNADEIFIAVAFLKRAGADLIAPLLEKRLAAGADVELFIGTDFFLTEPTALERSSAPSRPIAMRSTTGTPWAPSAHSASQSRCTQISGPSPRHDTRSSAPQSALSADGLGGRISPRPTLF